MQPTVVVIKLLTLKIEILIHETEYEINYVGNKIQWSYFNAIVSRTRDPCPSLILLLPRNRHPPPDAGRARAWWAAPPRLDAQRLRHATMQ